LQESTGICRKSKEMSESVGFHARLATRGRVYIPKIDPLELKKIGNGYDFTWMPTIGFTGLTSAYQSINTPKNHEGWFLRAAEPRQTIMTI